MIYFLVNNDYHLSWDIELAKELKISDYNISLIQIPYSLKTQKKSNVFNDTYLFEEKLFLSLNNPLKICHLKKRVKNKLRITKNDILFVHTDLDLLNQFIIQLFYDTNARVYLLEDGTATMTMYNVNSKKASLKHRFKANILKYIYNLKYTSVALYGPETVPIMSDHVFSGVIVNWGKSIKRNIPLFQIKNVSVTKLHLQNNGAIFYNQVVYFWFLSTESYLAYLREILLISENFDSFYFKFHPSENLQFKDDVTNLIRNEFKKIIIIEDSDNAEKLLEKYPVKYGISINSTACLNLINKGMSPVFLNYLFNLRFPDVNLEAFNRFLTSINVNFPKHLMDIKPGFEAFSEPLSNDSRLTLSEIINL